MSKLKNLEKTAKLRRLRPFLEKLKNLKSKSLNWKL